MTWSFIYKWCCLLSLVHFICSSVGLIREVTIISSRCVCVFWRMLSGQGNNDMRCNSWPYPTIVKSQIPNPLFFGVGMKSEWTHLSSRMYRGTREGRAEKGLKEIYGRRLEGKIQYFSLLIAPLFSFFAQHLCFFHPILTIPFLLLISSFCNYNGGQVEILIIF